MVALAKTNVLVSSCNVQQIYRSYVNAREIFISTELMLRTCFCRLSRNATPPKRIIDESRTSDSIRRRRNLPSFVALTIRLTFSQSQISRLRFNYRPYSVYLARKNRNVDEDHAKAEFHAQVFPRAFPFERLARARCSLRIQTTRRNAET